MRQIPLTQGKVALVDDDDYEVAVRHLWHAIYIPRARSEGGQWYAGATINRRRVYLHRFIMESSAPRVDHVNGDGLDNRRCNLRPATQAQNLCNRGPPANSTTGLKGVCFDKERRKFMAHIGVNGRLKFLGRFDTAEAASAARDRAAAEIQGEFAYLNNMVRR